jgi:hypothetical protein
MNWNMLLSIVAGFAIAEYFVWYSGRDSWLFGKRGSKNGNS